MSTKTKHCPGPWIVDGNGFSDSWNVSGVYSICNVAKRSDADLIAAAPSMLACLEALLSSPSTGVELKSIIRPLVERATGKFNE